MSVREVTTVFAVLGVVGAVGALLAIVGALLPPTRPTVLATLRRQGYPLAWVVATVATLGSLYLSEIADFPPCRLCWFQRIAMYPLVVVLGVGWWRREASPRLIAFVLAGVGLAVNLWHVAVEIRPSLEGSSCDPNNPCALRWIEVWGVWTIPRLATVAFVLVLTLLALDRSVADEEI